MLQTQVNYWNYMEGKRHNIQMEEQAARELSESIRHNVINENFNRYSLAESRRHNVAQEQLGFANLRETVRSHKANEYINQVNANTSRLRANIEATKVGFDNINMQYANRTNRMNAYTNEANSLIREGEYQLKQKQYDYDLAMTPVTMLRSLLPGGLGSLIPEKNVTRTVTKTRSKTSKHGTTRIKRK